MDGTDATQSSWLPISPPTPGEVPVRLLAREPWPYWWDVTHPLSLIHGNGLPTPQTCGTFSNRTTRSNTRPSTENCPRSAITKRWKTYTRDSVTSLMLPEIVAEVVTVVAIATAVATRRKKTAPMMVVTTIAVLPPIVKVTTRRATITSFFMPRITNWCKSPMVGSFFWMPEDASNGQEKQQTKTRSLRQSYCRNPSRKPMPTGDWRGSSRNNPRPTIRNAWKIPTWSANSLETHTPPVFFWVWLL
mmetsp:Transcript_281/g.718  ORF Transcript_281/g.718 Transcript_281/m.718 type:complete len:246 (+) Transcript_281:694-1431(+)